MPFEERDTEPILGLVERAAYSRRLDVQLHRSGADASAVCNGADGAQMSQVNLHGS